MPLLFRESQTHIYRQAGSRLFPTCRNFTLSRVLSLLSVELTFCSIADQNISDLNQYQQNKTWKTPRNWKELRLEKLWWFWDCILKIMITNSYLKFKSQDLWSAIINEELNVVGLWFPLYMIIILLESRPRYMWFCYEDKCVLHFIRIHYWGNPGFCTHPFHLDVNID